MLQRIKDACTSDNGLKEALSELREGRIPTLLSRQKIAAADCVERPDGLLFVNGLLYIPDRLDLRTCVVKAL